MKQRIETLDNFVFKTKLNEILDYKLLSWKEIEDEYGVTQKDLKQDALPDDYYPYDENGFNKKEVAIFVEAFKKAFPDAKIENEDKYKETSISIESLEQHQVIFSIIAKM